MATGIGALVQFAGVLDQLLLLARVAQEVCVRLQRVKSALGGAMAGQ